MKSMKSKCQIAVAGKTKRSEALHHALARRITLQTM
jgi:hypothetical protein